MQNESISLYQTKGATDKEYHCHLEAQDDGWTVYGRNGRRGGNLTHQAKTASPVTYPEAKGIYDALVKSKIKSGYTPSDSGTPFQGTELAQEFTGVLPQLLNPISEEQCFKLLHDDEWVMQEKDDGHRRMVSLKGPSTIVGSKRNGFPVPLPIAVVADLSVLPSATVIDSEALGARLSVFDILELGGKNLHNLGFEKRHALLTEAFKPTSNVLVSPVYKGTTAKLEAFTRIKEARGEGVVFRKKDAPYTIGRPASGGDVVKFVFYATSTFVVAKSAKGKRSVHIEVFNATGEKVDMGKVTIPANFDIPEPGTLVDVRYLYAHRDGKLHIPTYRGPRNDIDITACTIAQLKFKADGVADEDDEDIDA